MVKSTIEVRKLTRKLVKHNTTPPHYSLHINIPTSFISKLGLNAKDIMILRLKGNTITMEKLE